MHTNNGGSAMESYQLSVEHAAINMTKSDRLHNFFYEKIIERKYTSQSFYIFTQNIVLFTV